ncbi:MAG: iron-sulfur cluster assembly accessory protein [Caldibacillus sp.]
MAIVQLTEAAAFQIKDMLKENGEENAYIRVSVYGGGCSGLSYGLNVDYEVHENDELSEQHGVRVIVAKEHAPFLNGTVIDYKESLLGGGFTIDNPNAVYTCGCGSSFRTAENAGTPEKC